MGDNHIEYKGNYNSLKNEYNKRLEKITMLRDRLETEEAKMMKCITSMRLFDRI